METSDKYQKMLGVDDEELQKVIDSLTEKEAKEILQYIMSGYNKIRDDLLKFFPEEEPDDPDCQELTNENDTFFIDF